MTLINIYNIKKSLYIYICVMLGTFFPIQCISTSKSKYVQFLFAFPMSLRLAISRSLQFLKEFMSINYLISSFHVYHVSSIYSILFSLLI